MADSSGYYDSSGVPETRAKVSDVDMIMDLDSSFPDRKIEAFIYSANALVDERLGDTDLSSRILFEIERWLTAHLIKVSIERVSKKEEAKGAAIEYAGDFSGRGLESTQYGQTVIELDTTGKMKSLGEKQVMINAIKQF